MKRAIHKVVFKADSVAGRAFDLGVMSMILLSVLVVMLDSIASLQAPWGRVFFWTEWGFTLFFTLEYLLRLYSAKKPLQYAFSFFGVIDLLAILPSYLSLLAPGSQYLLVVRTLRTLRIFRVLKLTFYVKEAQSLSAAVGRSLGKIIIFLSFIVILVIILGSLMYLVEGSENGFTSIPRSMYWAIVTLTTVGYGDISPKTNLGQFLASLVMLMGYAILAVPTGIVTAELSKGTQASTNQPCTACGKKDLEADSKYCRYCGTLLSNS